MAYAILSNHPSAGRVSWSNLHIQYNGQSYSITNGNSNLKYIWWNPAVSTNSLQTSNTFPSIGVDGLLVILNLGGTAHLIPNSSTVRGDIIAPNTISKDKFTTTLQSELDTKADSVGTYPNLRAQATTKADVGLSSVLDVEQYPATNPSGFQTQAKVDSRISTQRPDADYKNSNTTKTDVGLSNVDNKSSATIRSEIVEANIPDLSATKITSDQLELARVPVEKVRENIQLSDIGLGESYNYEVGTGTIPASGVLTYSAPHLRISFTDGDSKYVQQELLTRFDNGETFTIRRTDNYSYIKFLATGITTFSDYYRVSVTVLDDDYSDGITNGNDVAIHFNGILENDIPNLSANKITSDTLGTARIPELAASKIIVPETIGSGKRLNDIFNQDDGLIKITEIDNSLSGRVSRLDNNGRLEGDNVKFINTNTNTVITDLLSEVSQLKNRVEELETGNPVNTAELILLIDSPDITKIVVNGAGEHEVGETVYISTSWNSLTNQDQIFLGWDQSTNYTLTGFDASALTTSFEMPAYNSREGVLELIAVWEGAQ